MISFNSTPISKAVKTEFSLNLGGSMDTNLFAGCGGSTMGQKTVADIPIDIAINHSADAIAMHKRKANTDQSIAALEGAA